MAAEERPLPPHRVGKGGEPLKLCRVGEVSPREGVERRLGSIKGGGQRGDARGGAPVAARNVVERVRDRGKDAEGGDKVWGGRGGGGKGVQGVGGWGDARGHCPGGSGGRGAAAVGAGGTRGGKATGGGTAAGGEGHLC